MQLPPSAELAATGVTSLVALALVRGAGALPPMRWSPAAMLGVSLLLGRAAVYVVHATVRAALFALLPAAPPRRPQPP